MDNNELDWMIEKHESKFNATTVCGISISTLSKDTLMACICSLLDMQTQASDDMARERELLHLMRRRTN
ncbi:hypothetical protein KAR91_18445 [Candidatus Pacearchaeota archaeon]|nr:hypothetical protein [Candidatus Pacearchaeota archaeon]